MDSIDGLRTFVSVIETGSFTAAAERLGMSKKLASKYVAELEARLDVKLLHRTTRTLSMTSAGQRYYPRCVALLEEFEAMAADVRDAETGVGGVLRISAPVTFGEVFLQGALAEFGALHPDLVIDLRLNDRYVDLVAEGFDLAIRIGQLEASNLISRRLGETHLLAVASPDYLERYGTPETPSALADHSCVRDSNYRGGQVWPFWGGSSFQKVAVQGPFLVNSATAVASLVRNGVGIGLCPDFAVSPDLVSGRLRQILVDFPSGKLDIHAVFTDARRMPARTRVVLDHLFDIGRSAPWLSSKEHCVPAEGNMR